MLLLCITVCSTAVMSASRPPGVEEEVCNGVSSYLGGHRELVVAEEESRGLQVNGDAGQRIRERGVGRLTREGRPLEPSGARVSPRVC